MTASAPAVPGAADREQVLRSRAARLAWATIGYNVAEGMVAIAAGAAAGSVALVSFGLDSGIEVLSAVAITWQYAGSGARAEEREHRTMRLIAVAFLVLAVYVAVDSLRALLGGAEPETSSVGIGLAGASLLVMPLLTWAKRRTGRELGSVSVLTDSTQTLLCTYLSLVLLGGLLLNATLGWGWADPMAGLVIAAVAAREGLQAWRGDACCAPRPALSPAGGDSRCQDGCCLQHGEKLQRAPLQIMPREEGGSG